MKPMTRARYARAVGALLLAFGYADVDRSPHITVGGWFMVLVGLILIIWMDGCDG